MGTIIMARQYPLKRWVSGTYKRECDICGFDFLRIELRENYKGLLVCDKDWEPEPRDWNRRPLRPERPAKIE
jgi:hypothetical protein